MQVLKEWVEKASMLKERCEHVMASTEFGIFVVGGIHLYQRRDDRYGLVHCKISAAGGGGGGVEWASFWWVIGAIGWCDQLV